MNRKIAEVKNRADGLFLNLSDEARAQLLIKALYNAKKRSPFEKLVDLYKMALNVKRVDPDRLKGILDTQVQSGKVLFVEGLYYLPEKTIKTLDEETLESKNRLAYIIDNFFNNSFSNRDDIIDWFIDATIIFFSSFTNAWISDLTNKESVVASKKDDIINQIRNRTNNNKKLDKRDKKVLAEKFFAFIVNKDRKVADFLWEYGTSAFSTNLIKKTAGTDELSLSIFEGSKCILDTNVLIDVALEGNERHDALDVLSEIFQELKVDVYTLCITREEYKTKIASKYSEIQRLMVGSFRKAIKNANDQFMKAAALRGCEESEDYDTMFDTLGHIPDNIGGIVRIYDYPEDDDLDAAMKLKMEDEKVRNDFKSLFFDMHGWEKNDIPLNHDLKLLGAAEHLCKESKVFILSDDSTMNAYAKKQPFEVLPMAVRLDTLINVLALKKGGIINRQHSFQDMFANIVRSGFVTTTGTFNIYDLSYILDKENQYAALSQEKLEEVAKEVNRMRILDKPELEIARYLVNQFQCEKLKVQGDLEEMKNKYNLEKEDNKDKTKKLLHAGSLLEASILGKANEKYKRCLICRVIAGIICCLIVIPGFVYGVVILFVPDNSLTANTNSLLGSIAATVIMDLFSVWRGFFPWIHDYVKNKEEKIETYKQEIYKDLERTSLNKNREANN